MIACTSCYRLAHASQVGSNFQCYNGKMRSQREKLLTAHDLMC